MGVVLEAEYEGLRLGLVLGAKMLGRFPVGASVGVASPRVGERDETSVGALVLCSGVGGEEEEGVAKEGVGETLFLVGYGEFAPCSPPSAGEGASVIMPSPSTRPGEVSEGFSVSTPLDTRVGWLANAGALVSVGELVGRFDGPLVGDNVGWKDVVVGILVTDGLLKEGDNIGPLEGFVVGPLDGWFVGDADGNSVGTSDGTMVGLNVGKSEGKALGVIVGVHVGSDVGAIVGFLVGGSVGTLVGI